MSVRVPDWCVFEATRHPIRREILDALVDGETPVHVEPLAAAFADSDEGNDQVVEALHHIHLPKLAEAGLVEYDQTSNRVTEVRAEATVALDAYEQWEAAYARARDTEDGDPTSPAPEATLGGGDPDRRLTVIVDVDLPADQFVLSDVVRSDPDVQIELERIVPLGDAILPFLWVWDGSNDEVERLLRTSAYVTDVTRLVALEDRALYQLEWTQDVDGVIGALVETEGVIMEGHGTADTWSLRLRFASHERFKRFAEHCRERGIDVTLRAVYNPHPPASTGVADTRPARRVRVAAEQGYFEVPRGTTMREIADYLGVSEQAVSQRLRRGLNTLVAGSIDV